MCAFSVVEVAFASAVITGDFHDVMDEFHMGNVVVGDIVVEAPDTPDDETLTVLRGTVAVVLNGSDSDVAFDAAGVTATAKGANVVVADTTFCWPSGPFMISSLLRLAGIPCFWKEFRSIVHQSWKHLWIHACTRDIYKSSIYLC